MNNISKPENMNDHSPLSLLRVALWLLLLLALSGCQLYPYLYTPTPPWDGDETETSTKPLILQTQTPLPSTTPPPTPTSIFETGEDGFLVYVTQQGDTLPTLAARFGVPMVGIQSDAELSSEGLLPVGVPLLIPDVLKDILPYPAPILPDSEVVYGPSVGDFDAAAYAVSAGGFLATYSETVDEETMTGPEIVQRVAIETSTNPRLLLAFLEYRSGWVLGHPEGAEDEDYPIGYGAGEDRGLYKELMITAKLLAQGFYGWREGSLVTLNFYGGETGRLSPKLNAGSVALMHLFATLYTREGWDYHLFDPGLFLDFYRNVFGDYGQRAAQVEPYLLAEVQEPTLIFPFAPGEGWSLTGGPHITWQTGTPWGALDFAPVTGEPHCAVSARWVTAAAPGLVVRSERSVVALDLDGDGDEGTGWVLIYQHVAGEDRVSVGTWLEQDALIGHPSCEGGKASGTHLHFARKFNGEWMGVSDPFPLILSGWQAYAGEYPYGGFLQKGEEFIIASPVGAGDSLIIRED